MLCVKVNRTNFVIYISFLFLVLAESEYLIRLGLSTILEYIGYIVLMANIWFMYFDLSRNTNFKNKMQYFLSILFLFCIGIMIQDLPNTTKLRLVFTMLVIDSCAIISDEYMSNFIKIRSAAYGIFTAVLINILLAVLGGIRLYDVVLENSFGAYAFKGGFVNKNYFSISVFSSFVGIYVFAKFVRPILADIFVIGLNTILMCLGNTRTVFILLILFIVLINLDAIKAINKKHRIVIIILAMGIVIISSYFLYFKITENSNSYMYRVNGLIRYLNIFGNDMFHLIFGNAEMAFASKTYVLNVRAITGWDGTQELALLNIIIKNGILGLLGYVIIIYRYLILIFKTKIWEFKIIMITIISILLISSLVENYMVNIHSIFGVFCYLFMSSICGIRYKYEQIN